MSHHASRIVPSEAKRPLFVGVDLGGTNIKVGVVDDLGRTLASFSEPTEVEKGPEDGARRMGEAVNKAINNAGIPKSDVKWVGLGTPGTMDIPTGLLLTPHNLPGWWHFPIRDRVSDHCGLPVAFANDAGAAAYGEFWVGSGREFHSMVFFTLGTGVGGGIIVGDLSLEGENSAGAELGHIIIDYNDTARLCSCGQRGHLEAYASATAVVERTQEALAAGGSSSLDSRLRSGAELTSLMVAQEAEQGDQLSLHIVSETARFLGIGAVSVMHTIDPAGVLIGGAMDFGGHESQLGRNFLARVREEVARRAIGNLAERTVIDFALLGSDAGYIGAAGIARLAYQKKIGSGSAA